MSTKGGKMSTKSIMRCCILSLSILLIFSVLPAVASQPGVIDGCLAEVTGATVNCSANDVRLTSIVPGTLSITEGCTGVGNFCFTVAGAQIQPPKPCTGTDKTQGNCSIGELCLDTVTFTATGQFVTGPNQRYDVGLYMSTDTDPNNNFAQSGQCERFAFLNDAPLVNVDGDACGDVPTSVTIPVDFGPVTIPCVDIKTENPGDPENPLPGSDGLVDVNHCETWGNSANAIPANKLDCNNSTDVRNETPSKCFCGLLGGACIAIPDTNPCTLDICQGNCQPASGTGGSNTACVDNTQCTVPGETCFNIHLQHIPQPGLACDDDSDKCTIDECTVVDNVGTCSHTPTIADCNDSDKCTDDACTNNACQHTPIIADCNDSDKCTTDACTSNACQHTPTIADCNDSDICTDDECIANACVNTFDPTNDYSCAPGEATCRTPGFWGEHAGTEKRTSQNITQEVINDCGGCLSICGVSVTNTLLQNASSAVEAICVSVAGDIRLQLARQLTAASLNCCVSGESSDCAGLDVWDEVFAYCNDNCASGITADTQLCINALDCLNNGGNIVDVVDSYVQCQTGTCSNGDPCGENLPACADLSPCVPLEDTCHTAVLGVCADGSICTTANTTLDANDKPICNSDGSVCQPGPAGSSNKCYLAGNKNNCAILPKPSSTGCSKFNQGETCCTNPGVTTCDVVD